MSIFPAKAPTFTPLAVLVFLMKRERPSTQKYSSWLLRQMF